MAISWLMLSVTILVNGVFASRVAENADHSMAVEATSQLSELQASAREMMQAAKEEPCKFAEEFGVDVSVGGKSSWLSMGSSTAGKNLFEDVQKKIQEVGVRCKSLQSANTALQSISARAAQLGGESSTEPNCAMLSPSDSIKTAKDCLSSAQAAQDAAEQESADEKEEINKQADAHDFLKTNESSELKWCENAMSTSHKAGRWLSGLSLGWGKSFEEKQDANKKQWAQANFTEQCKKFVQSEKVLEKARLYVTAVKSKLEHKETEFKCIRTLKTTSYDDFLKNNNESCMPFSATVPDAENTVSAMESEVKESAKQVMSLLNDAVAKAKGALTPDTDTDSTDELEDDSTSEAPPLIDPPIMDLEAPQKGFVGMMS